jgi:hypothetical protein
MSVTLLAWLCLFACLFVAALQRPIWGLALYFLTYFGDPASWWWGDPIESIRWNLIASIVAIASLFIHTPPQFRKLSDAWMEIILGLIVLNATVVHFGLAENLTISTKSYTLLTKFAVLAFLIKHTIRTPQDFLIFFLILTVAIGHIGYEVKINDQGKMIEGRLERVGPPTANSSNQLASLLVTTLPLMGTLALFGRPYQRIIATLAAPFAVNTVLLCNSRGAFLGALVSAVVYLILAPPRARRIALVIVLFGAIGTSFLIRDQRIVDRFFTTFAKPEQRDHSASGRLDFWKAGLRMLRDYPFGTGGDGFKKVHGKKYRVAYGSNEDSRSVHNGYINEACEWGLQGAALRMLIMFLAISKTIYVSRQLSRGGNAGFGLAGSSIAAGLAAFLVTSTFGDHLDDEWGLWLVALASAYEVLYKSGRIGTRPTPYTIYRLQSMPVGPKRELILQS